MTQSRIGMVVIQTPNRGKFFQDVRELNPRAMVVLNDSVLAIDIKDKLPDCEVVNRSKNARPGEDDDGESLVNDHTPAEWLDRMDAKLKGDKRIMLYAGNEMPLNARVVKWLCDLIRAANEQGWKLCVLNLATGNPTGQDIAGAWAVAKPLLELLAVHRQHVLGLHQYFGGVVTSGLHGGYPDNAGVAPGQPGGVNLIPRAAWPTDVRDVTCFHLGRHKFLMQYCDSAKISYPRIFVTEYGADETSDIKDWLSKLKVVAGYPGIRGWRTLIDQWGIWYRGVDPEEIYADMLIYGDKTFYTGSPVEAEMIFQLGNDTDWKGFNVWGANRLFARLVAHARAAQETPMYPTLPLPYADWRHAYASVQTGADYANLRARPVVDDTPPIARIFTGDEVWFIPDVRYEEFIAVRKNGLIGWASDSVLAFLDIKPAPDDEEPDTTPLEPSPDEIALQQEIAARTKIAEAYNSISTELRRLAIAEADLIEVLKSRKESIRLRRVA